MSDELARIREILSRNSEKDFVKRILDPENSPSIDLGKGVQATHLMAAEVDDDGRWLVFPTVVRINGKLERLEVNEAFHHAKSTGEYINFADKKDDALWFSKNYKKVWDE